MAPARLALQALEWSSRVSLEGDDAVLVEVGGSVRLFGGVNAITRKLPEDACWALAPTPLGALWLMRGAPGTVVVDSGRLPSTLGALPLTALALPPKLHERLHGFGLRHVHGLLRLSRASLARRVGQTLLDALRKALGELADPRPEWHPAPRFRGHRELEYETGSDAALLRAMEPLFTDLMALLRATGRGIRRCTVVMSHRDQAPTRIRIGLLEAVRSPDRLLEQLAIHLSRTPLPAPVVALALHAPRLELVTESARDLFATRASGESWVGLLERLRARLGDAALFQVQVHADHRPERAFHARVPWEQTPSPIAIECSPHHPLWLLPAPEPVTDTNRYRLERGPERIEYGWWDGGDVQRDYFVARDDHGARHWIFQERRPPYRWYLHGLFG